MSNLKKNRMNIITGAAHSGLTQLVLVNALEHAIQGKSVLVVSVEVKSEVLAARVVELLGANGADLLAASGGVIEFINVANGSPLTESAMVNAIANMVESSEYTDKYDLVVIDCLNMVLSNDVVINKNASMFGMVTRLNTLAMLSGTTYLANINVARASLITPPKIGGMWAELSGNQIGNIYNSRRDLNMMQITLMNGDVKTDPVIGVTCTDAEYAKERFPDPQITTPYIPQFEFQDFVQLMFDRFDRQNQCECDGNCAECKIGDEFTK